MLTAATIAVLAIAGYGVKSYFGINLFETFSLESVFPFNYLKAYLKASLKTHHLTYHTDPDIEWEDDFEERQSSDWNDPETATHECLGKTIVNEGIDGSGCLRITNPGPGDWACRQIGDTEVYPGEVYSLECHALTRGDDAAAYVSLVLFDGDRRLVDPDFGRQRIENTANAWGTVRTHFEIGEGISHIQLKISGSGRGEFLFDDIRLRSH